MGMDIGGFLVGLDVDNRRSPWMHAGGCVCNYAGARKGIYFFSGSNFCPIAADRRQARSVWKGTGDRRRRAPTSTTVTNTVGLNGGVHRVAVGFPLLARRRGTAERADQLEGFSRGRV